MSTLKTCLLISDDPDDHFEFSEALQETAAQFILISVFDSHKVVDLLRMKRILPDYIFLDLSMGEPNDKALTELIESQSNLQAIRLIRYGQDYTPKEKFSGNISTVLGKDFSYSELKQFLKRILGTHLSDGQTHVSDGQIA
jgi:DNA-binding NarL/FixJ family response regulator